MLCWKRSAVRLWSLIWFDSNKINFVATKLLDALPEKVSCFCEVQYGLTATKSTLWPQNCLMLCWKRSAVRLWSSVWFDSNKINFVATLCLQWPATPPPLFFFLRRVIEQQCRRQLCHGQVPSEKFEFHPVFQLQKLSCVCRVQHLQLQMQMWNWCGFKKIFFYYFWMWFDNFHIYTSVKRETLIMKYMSFN